MNRSSNDTQAVKLTGEEVAKHNNRESCWVIIHGRAYDITEFLPEHPGGPKIILKYAGKDATEEYEPIHPPDTLDKYLDKSKHLGEVDMNTVQQEEKEVDPEEEGRRERIARMPILEQCYNLMDFEAVARKVMKKSAWAYYSSGADDEIVSVCSCTIKTHANTATDTAREPQCLPQDLVQTSSPCRCREGGHVHYDARHESRHTLLCDCNSTGEAR
jgi:hypothetical protein